MTRTTVHGTMLCVQQCGLLITGQPGVGKTRLAVALLNRGHQLISDDATDIYASSSGLIAQCPPAIVNKLWLNGVGMLDVRQQWGQQALKKQQPLDLIIHLNPDISAPITGTQSLLGIEIKKISVSSPQLTLQHCRLLFP